MTTGHTPAFTLVRRGLFSRLWWASVVSSAGDWFSIFAAIAIADSIAGGTGTLLYLVARVIPGLLFGAVVGVIADRVDRRKLLIISDFGRAALVPFLAFVGDLPTLVLLGLALEFLSLLGQSPRAAVLPNLVNDEDIVSANSLMMGAAYGTIPVGAAAGLFLGALPSLDFGGFLPAANAQVALAFFADSLTFVASGAIMLTLPPIPIRPDGSAPASDQSSLDAVREGIVFLWRNREVRRIILGMSAALFGGGTVIVLGVPFVEDVLRADLQGFFAVLTALGVGAAVGVGGVSIYSGRLERREVVFALSTMLTGIGLAAGSITATVAGASGWLTLMGVGAGSAYVMGLSHLHEQVDDEMRGRVFAALFTLMRIGLFVSMTVAVPLAGAIRRARLPEPFDSPERDVLFAGGAIILVTGVIALWSMRKELRAALPEASRRLLEEASRPSYRTTPLVGPLRRVLKPPPPDDNDPQASPEEQPPA